MKLIGPLMIEHRLIERMLDLVDKAVLSAANNQKIDTQFLDSLVDFIRWYADKTHHGKEEALLFREVAKKDMSSEHRALLTELLSDHDFGRRTTGEIREATEKFRQGIPGSLPTLMEKCMTLTRFYHGHIEKEDIKFFPAGMIYLSEQEKELMLQEFREADRKMIHAKYVAVVEQYEKSKT